MILLLLGFIFIDSFVIDKLSPLLDLLIRCQDLSLVLVFRYYVIAFGNDIDDQVCILRSTKTIKHALQYCTCKVYFLEILFNQFISISQTRIDKVMER